MEIDLSLIALLVCKPWHLEIALVKIISPEHPVHLVDPHALWRLLAMIAHCILGFACRILGLNRGLRLLRDIEKL